jgi:hypothetical protein
MQLPEPRASGVGPMDCSAAVQVAEPYDDRLLMAARPFPFLYPLLASTFADNHLEFLSTSY